MAVFYKWKQSIDLFSDKSLSRHFNSFGNKRHRFWIQYDLDEKKLSVPSSHSLNRSPSEHDQIILAAPKNLKVMPISGSMIIEELDFSDLQQKYIGYFGINKHINQNAHSVESYHIKAIKVFDSIDEARNFISIQKNLAICMNKDLPNGDEFVIPYYTYDIKPACGRTIKKLIKEKIQDDEEIWQGKRDRADEQGWEDMKEQGLRDFFEDDSDNFWNVD